MAVKADIIQRETFLEVIVSGTYDMQDAIREFGLLLSTCRLTGLSKVLIDFRALQGSPAATEKIIYAYGVVERYRDHLASGGNALDVAYLDNPSRAGDYEPGLDVAREAGVPFRLFKDADEARRFLGV